MADFLIIIRVKGGVPIARGYKQAILVPKTGLAPILVSLRDGKGTRAGKNEER
jgi:hypothetical protein